MQNSQNYVKIAVGILSEKAPIDEDGSLKEFPEGQQALRLWAVQILNKYSPDLQIPDKLRDALVTGEADIAIESYNSGGFNNSTKALGGGGADNSSGR